MEFATLQPGEYENRRAIQADIKEAKNETAGTRQIRETLEYAA